MYIGIWLGFLFILYLFMCVHTCIYFFIRCFWHAVAQWHHMGSCNLFSIVSGNGLLLDCTKPLLLVMPTLAQVIVAWQHQDIINIDSVLRATRYLGNILQWNQCWPSFTANLATMNLTMHIAYTYLIWETTNSGVYEMNFFIPESTQVIYTGTYKESPCWQNSHVSRWPSSSQFKSYLFYPCWKTTWHIRPLWQVVFSERFPCGSNGICTVPPQN